MTALLPPDPVPATYIRRCLACGEPVVGPELMHHSTPARRDLPPARDDNDDGHAPRTEHPSSAFNGT
jgi:hypothetical protein